MSQLTQPVTSPATADARVTNSSTTLWRVAGGFLIGYVALTFVGVSFEPLVEHGASTATLQDKYGGADLTRAFTGGYLESLSAILLAAAVVLVARIFTRRTEAGRMAAQTFLVLGVVAVASALAVGFPAGAAALYGSQHGADIQSVSMVNDIRNYAYFLAVAVQAAMAIALGIAALTEKLFVKWVGWVGIAAGAIGIVAVPFAHNVVNMALLVWTVGLGVLLLRGPKAAPDTK